MRNQPHKGLLAAAVFLIAVHVAAALYIHQRLAWGDEEYLVDAVRYFDRGINLDALAHHCELSGPLPFVVYAAWGRVVGTSLPALRTLWRCRMKTCHPTLLAAECCTSLPILRFRPAYFQAIQALKSAFSAGGDPFKTGGMSGCQGLLCANHEAFAGI